MNRRLVSAFLRIPWRDPDFMQRAWWIGWVVVVAFYILAIVHAAANLHAGAHRMGVAPQSGVGPGDGR